MERIRLDIVVPEHPLLEIAELLMKTGLGDILSPTTETASIMVVGDANVDLMLAGDVYPRFGQAEQLLERADLVLGGSAAITASGLARLGITTSIVAVIGGDQFGTFVTDSLSATGVDVNHVSVDVADPTGISVHLSTADDRAILTHVGTIAHLTADAVRRAVGAARPDHVHFAAYFLLPGLASELPQLLTWLKQRGISTSLDTNWDPIGRWEGLDAVLPRIDYLFPNLEELRTIGAAVLPEPAPTDAVTAAALAALGPVVVVKAGAQGGWSLGSAAGSAHADALPVQVVDSTGAGDSFDAGYLAAMAHGIDDEATRLSWAAVAGSISTTRPGGTQGQVTHVELLGHVGGAGERTTPAEADETGTA